MDSMARNGRSSGTTPDTSSQIAPKADSGAKSPNSAAVRTPIRSQKLDRTLKELESAFTDWEDISSIAAKPKKESGKDAALAKAEKKGKDALKLSQTEKEFRKKTKKLLTQLRQQLAELNE